MPQIIVTAGDAAHPTEVALTLRERINASDFESDRFAENLLERLRWAVGDATEVELREPTERQEPSPQQPNDRELQEARELVEA